MIISKTPLRISFFSGGSDMESFYKKEPGAALSCTIDKYIYTLVHQSRHMNFKTMYDDIQTYESLDDIQHDITREALKYYGMSSMTDTVTTGSISDIIAKGSGLGSSSAFTVGILNCLKQSQENTFGKFSKLYDNKRVLAEEACKIEIEKCGFPIGKQDQYAAAYGGFNLYRFNTDGSVDITSPSIPEKALRKLENNLFLVYSGKPRSANAILKKQNDAMTDSHKFQLVANSRDKAYEGMKLLCENKVEDFAHLLHRAWMDKKQVTKDISNTFFDDIYDKAIQNGAIGGKLLGAGGGGFFIFYVPPDSRRDVAIAITNGTGCKIYDFNFTFNGSTIIGND